VKVLEELKSILGSKKGERETQDGEGKDKKKKKEAPTEKKVEVALSSQQIELRAGPTQLLSRLIEGKFPDYQQIIPKEKKTTATFSTKELTTVIKRMHYFAKETNNNLTFNLAKGEAHITTPQTQAGKDEATLSVEISGGNNKIALSSSYLLDFLGHIDDENVEMQVTDSMHPAVFRLPSNEQLLHLIMPLRMQEE